MHYQFNEPYPLNDYEAMSSSNFLREARHTQYSACLFALCLLIPASLLVSPEVSAQGASDSKDDYIIDGHNIENVSRKLTIGLGVGLERFDTNFKFTDKATGDSVFVDLEGTLGLPETDTVPIIYGYWRISPRHGLGFSYYQIRREASIFAIDENLGDLTVTGDVSLSDRSRFYYLSYNYTAYHDDRSYVFWSVGLNAIDLRYQLDATGTLDINGTPVASGEYSTGVNQIAPLPMIGVDAWFAITPKWAFGTKLAFIFGTYKDISARISEFKVRAKYAYNKNLGLTFGFNFFQGIIEIDDTDVFTDINYGFNGFKIGVDLGF